MRLFIAVELDAAVRNAAWRIAEQLAGELGPGGRQKGVSWVAPPNLHLTIRFLGEVDPVVAARLADRLAPPLTTPPFDVAVSGVGAFPPSGPPRVIWLGVTEGVPGLAELHREVEARLEDMAREPDDRPFRVHLTLGRVKAPLGPHVREVLSRLATAAAGRCRIDHVTVFESRLSPKGPIYRALAVSRLGG